MNKEDLTIIILAIALGLAGFFVLVFVVLTFTQVWGITHISDMNLSSMRSG